ncbi:hypothetical protein LCGC14_0455380 [marine sediment metagenome]|uniref:Uncharacterized protein n=1 Tax=marine sediment metagenome TaxID=412755 RepID=A0A0F9SLX0_9ZZZZ
MDEDQELQWLLNLAVEHQDISPDDIEAWAARLAKDVKDAND